MDNEGKENLTSFIEGITEEYFPVTKSISKKEFDFRAKRSLEKGVKTFNNTPIFGENGQIEQKVDLIYNKGTIEIGINISADEARRLSEEQRQKLHIGPEGGHILYTQEPKPETDSKYSNNTDDRIQEQSQIADVKFGPAPTYFIHGETPRTAEANEAKVKKISIEEVARIINDTQGESLIFYTGAGISKGGEKPIWSMNEFNKEMHQDNGTFTFLSELADNPEGISQKFRQFNNLFYEDVSTPAHIAIAEIIKEKPGSIVFTENFDMKHEAEGSRIEPVHLGTLQSHLDLMARAKEAEVLITVGLSHDDRAAIAYLKKVSPDLKLIVSLSLPTEKAPLPNFIQESDKDPNGAVLLGDCQETLPKIAEQVKQPGKQSLTNCTK